MHLTRVIGFLLFAIGFAGGTMAYAQEDAQLKHYRRTIRPILDQHCFSCHNEPDKKGGLNLEKYDFIVAIVRDGPVWVKVMEQIRQGEMPPQTKPPIPEDDKETLVEGIEAILDSALSVPDPGQVVMRRLSNREYRYTVLDLLGVDFDSRSFFPADASGGEGFDNQGKVLYITPLQMERYLSAADSIVTRAYEDATLWRRIVPEPFPRSRFHRTLLDVHDYWRADDVWEEAAVDAAGQALLPLAVRAYRRPLTKEDRDRLLGVFSNVYAQSEGARQHRFDRGIQESLKYMLLSPNFLYRRELELPDQRPYLITRFELASRLSYFLWSSAPDDELLDAAYREDLHDPEVMFRQVERMLADPRSMRFAESFAGQWLEIDDLLDTHEVDPALYPGYTSTLREAMHRESVLFFHHVLTGSRNFLDLLDSDYTFLNETMASHYAFDAVEGSAFRKIGLPDPNRGGVLGMASVLTVTSLPTRTSPVLRGKWVLEQLLGTPPPPPPADVPELEEQGAADNDAVPGELDIRTLLRRHREPTACFNCHQKMDPLGLGLENFDAIGRWRDAYGATPIEASGVLPRGDTFDGPAALRTVLLSRKDLFARNLSRKVLSYALGRGVRFQDKRTVDALTATLLDNDFETVSFMHAVVMSYPFRYKKSDPPIQESAP